jgi:hypothetical protein
MLAWLTVEATLFDLTFICHWCTVRLVLYEGEPWSVILSSTKVIRCFVKQVLRIELVSKRGRVERKAE